MSKLIAELTATISALGCGKISTSGYDEVDENNHYRIDKECKEAIRELIRFLRRDDESHEIRRYIASAGVLQNDLLPILIQQHQDEEMFDLLLRLLVNLTIPALLLYNEELPTDKVSSQQYLEMVGHLQRYKQAFATKELWVILSEKLSQLLKLDWADRGEERSLIIVRILILTRNILQVPEDVDTEKRPDNDPNVHDQVLWALCEGGMKDLVIYIASSENEQQYYFHILEITMLMLRDQNAEVLASASVQRTIAEKQRDERELVNALKKEKMDQQKRKTKYIIARNPRFASTYGVKTVGDKDIVVHSLDDSQRLSFDRYKNKLKTPKNRRPMESDKVERRSAFIVRVLMKEFCIEFLNGAYNHLMRHVREIIHRGKSQANDESYYFWALQFFMEFNRYYKFEIKLISETMHVSIFHFTQERIENWRGKLITDKKKFRLWSRRMHLGLKAYKELLHTLFKMYEHADETVKQSAHTIMSNIFYVVEYRELLMVLLNLFDEVKFSLDYLKDLIEANHIFMKMLEHICQRHRTLLVQKKVQKRKKKSKNAERRKTTTTTTNMEPSEEKWTEIESRITEILENNVELNVQAIPFDAASDVPFDEQKVEAMRRIRYLMMTKEIEEAIGLLKASREVWPENDCFGSADMSPSEEVAALKEILFADIALPNAVRINENDENTDGEHGSDENDDDDDGNDTTAAYVNVNEQNLQFMDFVKKFAKPKIAYACCLLLSQFKKNSIYTNHCIVKLLHRITFDCKYSAMLFQASVFRIFQQILDSDEQYHKELKKFAIYIVRKFTEVAKKNSKVFMELLFWKSNKEAYEIEEGYGTLMSSSNEIPWTEEQEDELRRLYSEYERDKPDQDMVDWISRNLINQNRSRRSLKQKLRQFDLLNDAQNRGISTRRPPKEFSSEEIAQITELVNQFREAMDPMSCIMERLDVYRPKKRIIDKIMELGLVSDRKELHKKRGRNTINHTNDEDLDINDTESSNDDQSDSDEAHENQPSNNSSNANQTYAPDVAARKTRELVNLGMKDACEWIISCLEDVIEDLGDDESDVPIVPLAEHAIQAIENEIFQSLLIALGIQRPVDFQEMYWRIPGSWHANDLRRRITLIKTVFEEPIAVDSVSLVSGDGEESRNESGERRNDVQSHGSSENSVSLDASENLEDIGEVEGNSNIVERSKKRKRFDIHEFRTAVSEEASTKRKRKKIRRIINDNSDEELLNQNSQLASVNEEPVSIPYLSSKDDSDNETETTSSFMKRKSSKRVLSSDDSDIEETFPSVLNGSRVVGKSRPQMLPPENSDDENSNEKQIKELNGVADVVESELKPQDDKSHSATSSENSD